MILKSNYPWLFSSRNEIKNNEVLSEHKTLPIISLSEIGRKSLTALKNVILHDKYAHIVELLTHVGVFKKWNKSLSKVATGSKTAMCLVHGANIMTKKKIMFYTASMVPPLPEFIDCGDILGCIYANEEARLRVYYEKILAHYRMQHTDVEQILSSAKSIQYIRSICEIVLGNNRKIITYLQGKKSAVRTAVPKRVLSCRAQICLAPYLTATQIGIPYWWAKYVNFETSSRDLNIFKFDRICEQLPPEYVYNLQGQRILGKRDPIIHILAFCVFDQVFFHGDSRFHISAESLKKMAADFDGDTIILYFASDLKVMYEIDANASPRYSMALHGQCRINLIESIVLAMYGRDVSGKIPHWRLYNFLRYRCIYKWLCNIRNCSTLEAISGMSANNEFPLGRLYNMVEPTDLILAEMLMVLYTVYGSQESYKFYCEILRLSMELSIGFKSATLYQPDLPCDYTLTDNLLNFNLLAVSFSCAKGSIHTFKSLLDKIYDKDQQTRLCKSRDNEDDNNHDYEKLISDITNANIYAAKKSKQVPQQGYNLFKDTIEGDLMSFGGNRLNYNNEVLIEHVYLKIPLQYILKPSVAYTILFE